MLDGIFGRGFSSKSKSLIKLTKSRIDVIRRKRSATQKFLKKDVADLLANGLDINAYGRAEALLAELIVSSCYDFIEKCCDYVLQQLSVVQKERECPEDCRVAVSSLMFAAARFSDLPELRDLRDIFYERYGNSLEFFVNQQFVENLSSKPYAMEKKVKLMEDVASEFSIKWNREAFEQRMSKPTPTLQDQSKNYVAFHVNYDTDRSSYSKITDQHRENDLPLKAMLEMDNKSPSLHEVKKDVSKRSGPIHQSRQEFSIKGYKSCREETLLKKDNRDVFLWGREEISGGKHDPWKGKEDSLSGSSNGKTRQRINHGTMVHHGQDESLHRLNGRDVLQGKPDHSPCHAEQALENHFKDPFTGDKPGDKFSIGSSTWKVNEDDKSKSKPHYNIGVPPPYVKPNVKPKESSRAASLGSCPAGFERGNISMCDRSYTGSWSDKKQDNLDHSGNEKQIISPVKVNSHDYEKDYYYGDDCVDNRIPKPRSNRRRHAKSSSSHDNVNNYEDNGVVKIRSRSRRRDEASHEHVDDLEDVVKIRSRSRRKDELSHDNIGNLDDNGAVKTMSRSRRRNDAKRGLQILFDDERHHNDEEEKIIDKLLMHYSKKPSAYEHGKVRRSKNCHTQGTDADIGEVPQNGSRDVSDEIPPPARSVSLPHEQGTQPEKIKVFARAASFQPDRSNVPYVHPKLPDYDDLAARFAALKGR